MLEACPVCQSVVLSEMLVRDNVPVQQHLLLPDHQAARSIARGTMRVAVCTACGFVFNRAFEPQLLRYDAAYDNNQLASAAFDAHVSERIDYLVHTRHVRDARIAEIGCGSGLFLRRLVSAGSGNAGIGIDPAYHGPREDLDGRIEFRTDLWGSQTPPVPADVVVCRHVIEHLSDPVGLLHSIRCTLPAATLFFETPDVEWILRRHVLWDFFYEHCSYFSAPSVVTAFEQAGYRVRQVDRVFNDQYLWVEAEPAGSPPPQGTVPDAGKLPGLANEFGQAERVLVDRWRAAVRTLAERGGVALWGAGAKGVTFANLVDPDQQWVRCVVDIYSAKQGHYIPGTGHPIVAPDALHDRHVSTVLLMNPNYYDEVVATLASQRLDPLLIDLTEIARENTD